MLRNWLARLRFLDTPAERVIACLQPVRPPTMPMFRTPIRIRLFLLLLFAAFAPACAVNPPVQEMSNARQAIEAAVASGAEIHAPSELAEAHALLDQASDALGEEDYPAARRHALEAKAAAIRARQESLRKRQADHAR